MNTCLTKKKYFWEYFIYLRTFFEYSLKGSFFWLSPPPHPFPLAGNQNYPRFIGKRGGGGKGIGGSRPEKKIFFPHLCIHVRREEREKSLSCLSFTLMHIHIRRQRERISNSRSFFFFIFCCYRCVWEIGRGEKVRFQDVHAKKKYKSSSFHHRKNKIADDDP